MRFLLAFCLLLTSGLQASILETVPVNYKGRIRPLDAYSRLLLKDFYGSSRIRLKDLKDFPLSSDSSLEFALKLYSFGFSYFEKAPLFLLTPTDQKRFSYYELKEQKNLSDELLQKIRRFESFKGLVQQNFQMDGQPWAQQLKSDPNFLLLPNRHSPAWLPLSALGFRELGKPLANFTLYSPTNYALIESSFRNWQTSLKNGEFSPPELLAEALVNAYQEIASTPFISGDTNTLYYPSVNQLKAEVWYHKTPLVTWAILGYLVATFCFLAPSGLTILGLISFFSALALQTLTLALRCYILGRPPVSNMFETVIYVPWVASILSLILAKHTRSTLPLAASAILATILLTILEYTHLNDSLENVQAVLNSRFWLIIHVLMIVGSYGVLILAGVLAHFYLITSWFKPASPKLSLLSKCLVQSLYCGLALLIPGTILGGVWAAQSWGRFWDWDPKESWAFISACAYLVVVHLYRFNLIGIKGLCVGAIVGLGFISFTWYGVNYILGTGLHTYGFGSGSHLGYFLYLGFEALFLLVIIFLLKNERNACKKIV